MSKMHIMLFAALMLQGCGQKAADTAQIEAEELEMEAVDTCQVFIPKIITLDSHADTPLDFCKGVQLGEYNEKIQVSLPRLRQGGVNAQYLACWVRQEELTPQGREKARQRVFELIDSCHSQVARNDSVCGMARNAEEVYTLVNQGKTAFLIGVENGYGIGLDLDVIDQYKERGVSYITLCHSKNNDICDSSSDKSGPLWNGLSDFGREVVRKMNAEGILIDLSHASEKTFWDVLELSTKPVVCTHSGAKAVYNHNRNLTDDQLRAIAGKGGVVQVCAVDDFVCANSKQASIDHFMAHLLHVIEVAGVDHAGIGTDFDGGGGVKGFNGSEDFPVVVDRLRQAGFTQQEIAKIMGGNFLRLL